MSELHILQSLPSTSLPLSEEGFQQTSPFETITFLPEVLILASHSFPESNIFFSHKMQEEEAIDHVSPGCQDADYYAKNHFVQSIVENVLQALWNGPFLFSSHVWGLGFCWVWFGFFVSLYRC